MKILKSEVLNLFINNISQFVFWKDRNSVYQGCNNNFAEYAGFDNAESIIGKTDYDLPWSKEEADFFIKIDQEVMNSGQSQLNFEEPQTLGDGSTRWISTSKVPLYDDDGKGVIGILGWYIDITPYKSMQIQIDEKNETLFNYSQRLEQSARELEQANSDMEMFTYAVSHDLKSPIRNIVSFTDLILKTQQGKLDNKVIEQLQIVLTSGKNMNNLVQNILTYARAGMGELLAQEVDIKKVISDKLEDLDNLLLRKDAKINIDFPDTTISCYPELLGIVFYNLIGNGLKYNESNPPTVKCTMETSDTNIIFSVKDNGIGISPDFQEEIFQPFKRLHSSIIEGSGLGLSICKRIIELHKGKIWIDKNTEEGSDFKFSIPKNI